MRHTSSCRPNSLRSLTYVILLFSVAWSPTVAQAHHNMDGDTPMTFLQGLTSGLAHPILGLDHLVVLLLLGAVCGSLKTAAWPSLSFATLSVLGCLLHASHVSWPHAELSLAVSIVAAGPLAWLIARSGKREALAIPGVLGLLHGYAYGESMVGADPWSLAGYVAGLFVMQLAVLWLAAKLVARASGPSRLDLIQVLSLACLCVGATALYLGTA